MTERTQAPNRGLWMYCIIETHGEMKWDCLGIHGTSPVFTVSGGGFTAVVSEEPMKKYPLVRDTLVTHARVNEEAMKTRKVLPVRFCTMAESREKIVEEVLLPKAVEFRKSFSKIAGKDEYGLRVRWKDLDQVFREIGKTDEKIRRKKEMILSLPEGQRRTELIDIGHIVQEAVQEKNEKTAQTLVEALTPLAADVKKNNTLGDAMILNTAFLVENSKQEVFDQAVATLDTKYGDALQFKYVGPVPPFNFVEIIIKWRENPPSPPLSKGGLEGEARRVSVG